MFILKQYKKSLIALIRLFYSTIYNNDVFLLSVYIGMIGIAFIK